MEVLHPPDTTQRVIQFGAFEVDLASGQLRKNGVLIKLREQSFQVLAALLERPGEVVTREQLRDRLWNGSVHVDFENNLNAIIGRLRQALCDTADYPRFVETLPKRGYRFLVPIQAKETNGGRSAVQRVEAVAPVAPGPAADETPCLSHRLLAASIQAPYTLAWLWLYASLLEIWEHVNNTRVYGVTSFERSVLIAQVIAVVGVILEILFAVCMLRKATSAKLLARLFPVYCAFNWMGACVATAIAGYLLGSHLFGFAVAFPTIIVLGGYGPFSQRRLLQPTSAGS